MFNNYSMTENEGTTLVVDWDTKKAKMLYDYNYEGRTLIFDEDRIDTILRSFGLSVEEIIKNNMAERFHNDVYGVGPSYLIYRMDA
jgi:hypothetical protein